MAAAEINRGDRLQSWYGEKKNPLATTTHTAHAYATKTATSRLLYAL